MPNDSPMVSNVLILEDDEVIGQGMAQHLAAAGFDPLRVANGEPGSRASATSSPRLRPRPNAAGPRRLELIETARAEGIGMPIVVVSARGTEHDRIHALELGATTTS